MPKIYQRFDLDEVVLEDEEVSRAIAQGLRQLDGTFAELLKNEMLKKGYEVLEANRSWAGVPYSIIIGGDVNQPIKQDFHTIAGPLNIPFKSGYFYFKH